MGMTLNKSLAGLPFRQGTSRRTRTAVYLHLGPLLYPEIPLNRWPNRKSPGRLFFQFLRDIGTGNLCWNSTLDSIACEVNTPITEGCVTSTMLSTLNEINKWVLTVKMIQTEV